MKTTNYFNTFIEVAEDCPAQTAVIPQSRGGQPTVAQLQFEILNAHPYRYTSDDVLFAVHAERQGLSPASSADRNAFFAKPQACFRASPLTKRYGWGVHFDADGKMALCALESEDYARMQRDSQLEHKRAMRNKRKQ